MTATFPQPYCSNFPRVAFTYIGATNEDDNNYTTYTFGSITLPSAGLYAFVVHGSSSSSRSLASMTVGGVAANIIAGTNPAALSVNAIAYLRVASAGAVVISPTFSGQMGTAVVHVYKITGNRKDAPYSANNAYATAGSALSISLNIPRGGGAIFGAEIYTNSSNSSYTWAGATEVYDVYSTVEKWTRSGAIIAPNNGALARSVTATSAIAATTLGLGLSGAAWI